MNAAAMKTEYREIAIRELTNSFQDNNENGITSYYGRLDIRPPYQREFIYKDSKRDAVIETVRGNLPLNLMYWNVRDDGNYEIIDGQQRTISICQYVNNDFTINDRYFQNLEDDEQEQILNYTLKVYLCSGTSCQKLKWFQTINLAGEELTDQELRNATYAGPWVTDAKKFFSKTGCPAADIGRKYLTGTANRQDYLKTVLKWINQGNIEEYMSTHQNKPNANELKRYFKTVITWVNTTFPEYRKEMKGLDWGTLYDQFKDAVIDAQELENEIKSLMSDDDVSNKKGIYSYVLTRDERSLNIRQFSDSQKSGAYARQDGICQKCGEHFEIDKMEADHTTPWSEGGKTDAANCTMLCREDNRRKGAK